MGIKRILLVEDNPDDEMLTMRAIRKYDSPNQVDVARDGEEALLHLFGEDDKGLTETIPDLVLLDLKMPKLDGFGLLSSIRAAEPTRYIPVVVLTTSDHDTDIIRSYDLGANSYIRKSLDFQIFVETVRQIVYYWLELNTVPPKAPH